MYIYTYITIYTYIYRMYILCACVCMYVLCMYVCVYVWMDGCIGIFTYVCIHV